MSWKLKPVSFFKNFAAGLSVVTMCISPVAQGAAAADQKKLINRYLKETGLTTKKMTVGEFWRMVRHVYPPKIQKQMDQWVAKNQNEMMPSVSATSFKDADDKEQVRLTLSKKGQSMTLTFTGDEEMPLKINSVPFSKNELTDANKFFDVPSKLVKQDPALGKTYNISSTAPTGKNLVLTYDQYKKLSAKKKAEYLILLRLAMESSQRVVETIYGPQAYQELNNKYEWVLQFLFGDVAQAKSKAKYKSKSSLTGQTCVVAGYLSKYGENGSCGGDKLGAEDLRSQMGLNGASCAGNAIPCNPLVYGFDANNKAHCVPRAPRKTINSATLICNKNSPLNGAGDKDNIKRIIESFMKNNEKKEIDLKFDKDGKISKEQFAEIEGYLTKLNELINNAKFECNNLPLLETRAARVDQDEACLELEKRGFALNVFKENNVPAPAAVPLAQNDKECNKPGQSMRDGSCGCTYGMDEDGECLLAAPVITAGEDSCGFWCRNKNWIIPVGVFAVAGGLMWWLLGSKNKSKADPVYVPPAPVPDPGTQNPATPPPVSPPPPAPCPAPNTLVGGVCVPPVVVGPPVTNTPPSVEGGTNPGGPSAAGVR